MGGLPWIFGSYLFEIILCLLLNVLVTDRLVAFKIKTILNFQLAFYNKICLTKQQNTSILYYVCPYLYFIKYFLSTACYQQYNNSRG